MIRSPIFVLAALASFASACASTPSTNAAAGQQERARPRAVAACGQSDQRADFGNLRHGALVRLHEHSDDDVRPNWSPDMHFYVDQVTRVTELLGVDAEGCPGVRVEADAGVFFWRVRDLEVEAETSQATRCGQNELTADFIGLEPGMTVRVRQGSDWFGRQNWVPEMNAYVGQSSVVTARDGVDEAGCPGVSLALDDGVFFWRVRDLEPTPVAALPSDN